VIDWALVTGILAAALSFGIGIVRYIRSRGDARKNTLNDPGLELFATGFIRSAMTLLKEAKRGRFTLNAAQWPSGFSKLSEICSRYDTVSHLEKGFDLPGPIQRLGEEHFNCSTDLVRNGKIVTRMFLLSTSKSITWTDCRKF
jgi:hypothetical protein